MIKDHPAVNRLLARVDALPQRDRWTVAAGIVALAIGLQWGIVNPLQERRKNIESSALAEDDAQSLAQASEQAARTAQLDALKTRQAETTRQLATLGLAPASHDSVGALIARTLPDSEVQLVGLQALPVEELMPSDALEAGMAPNTPLPADTAAAMPADAAAPMLYRHRAELRLEGPVPQLLQALDLVERRMSPLRVERVRLAAVPGGVQALVVLTTLSRDRTWLAL